MKLSIIIPAHNEAHRLPPVLVDFVKFFTQKLKDDYEILVVANGCSDNTALLAREIAEQYPPQVKVIDEPAQIGKGGAIILGVKAALGDWIGFVDADGATSPEEFERLFQKTKGTGGVIASRWASGAQINIPQKGMRLLSSRLFNLFIRGVLGLKFKDTQCGAKIFLAEAWHKILPRVGTTRFAFDVDLLYQLKRTGFSVLEEPTVWNDVEGSKVQLFNSSFDMFCAVIRMRLLYSPLRFIVFWYEHVLSRIVEFFLRDALFRHAALLFFASILAAVGNVGFQMIVGRMPQTEYALLATFLALFAIVVRPLGTLTTGISHYTSILRKEGREDCIRGLLVKWLLLSGIPAILLAVICFLFSQQIASFFHLERVAPVWVSAVALPALFIGPVLAGTLLGLQKYRWSAIAGIISAFGRVALGAIFVFVLYKASGWALAGHVGSRYIFVILCFCGLQPLLRSKRGKCRKLPSLKLYLSQCFIIQMSAAVLMTADVVLVKHFIPSDIEFAYAATLGRMVAFMAAPVVLAMFPKVSSEGEFTHQHRRIYLRSMLYSSFIIMGSLLVCLVFPRGTLHFLYPLVRPSETLLGLTRWMAVAMAFATFLNINVFMLLAQRRFRHLAVTVVCAVAYLGVVSLFHSSSYAVVFAAIAFNFIAFSITTIAILKGSSLQRIQQER